MRCAGLCCAVPWCGILLCRGPGPAGEGGALRWAVLRCAVVRCAVVCCAVLFCVLLQFRSWDRDLLEKEVCCAVLWGALAAGQQLEWSAAGYSVCFAFICRCAASTRRGISENQRTLLNALPCRSTPPPFLSSRPSPRRRSSCECKQQRNEVQGRQHRPDGARAANHCPHQWQQARRPALLLSTTALPTVLRASCLQVHAVLCGDSRGHHHIWRPGVAHPGGQAGAGR